MPTSPPGHTPTQAGALSHTPSFSRRAVARVWLLAVLAMLTMSAVGLERVLSGYVVSVAESNAVRVGRGIVASQADALLTMGPERHLLLDLSDENVVRLDEAVQGFALSFDILKVKLYSPDARIIYSTDPAIIGIVDAGNERLADALHGGLSSGLENKETVVDLKEETRFAVDVVETYVPIYSVQAEVVGVFEIYQDVTGYHTDMRTHYYYALAVVGAVVLLVSVAGYLLLRRTAVPGPEESRPPREHDPGSPAP